ncbi:diguanylate cyclase domain-containing protein [Fervidobacterium thailandense]|uniref:Diguanylate cyclase n=1 Tax=Fervidobacterium thailandense TaxID=1008305 RepID=A0A1E3G0B1_9BACT|nr:diguanylate cyclase [Fervidobacterium thailandense]ODN29657.1 diguanylate cyclase [Fervidobacterium thailandense]
MRSLIENHVEDFLEILTYEKRFWYEFWQKLPFKPITKNYESFFENFESLLKSVSRNEMTEFSHDFEKYKEELKDSIPQFVRLHARDLELSKEDFIVFLIAGPGIKDWVVVDGKNEKVIVVDVFSVWKKGKLNKLSDVVYQAAIHFRHGETAGDYYDKDELFEFLRSEIAKLPNEVLLEEIPKLLDKHVPYYNWTGFYLMDQEGMLVLGPYVGEPTEHVRIPVGRGICGQAAERKVTFIVQDVTQESNYLSCSPLTKSEIVVPIFRNDGSVYGEIDIDSHYIAPFDDRDRRFLEWVAKQITVRVVHWNEFERRIRIAYLDSYIAYILNQILNYNLKFSVELSVYSDWEKVPENLYRFWKIARKLPNASVERVSIVDSVEEQSVVLKSEHGSYVLKYEDLLMHPKNLMLKLIKELSPEVSSKLFEIHYEATKYAQSLLNSQIIIEYALKPDSSINAILYAFLTGITAGYSGSFNRAMFFSYSDGKFVFQRALGPRTLEEAYKIWEAIEDIELNMRDFIENVSKEFRSALEIPYEGKTVSFELVSEYADGQVHVLTKKEAPEIAKEFDINKDFAIMILRNGDKILGMILADNNFDLKPISHYQMNILKELGNLMILVLENKRYLETMKQKAEVDMLTGLKTRRFLEEFIEQANLESCCVVFLDLNKFKQINDTFGHEKGDEVLRNFGKCINLNIRKDDLAFRYGGDEAVLILKTTDRNIVERIIGRILDCFESRTGLSFSAGAALFPLEGDMKTVLKKADERCYKSKATGRLEF